MGRRLSGYVHVGGRMYGPDDDVPSDVAARITNPKAWAEPMDVEGPPLLGSSTLAGAGGEPDPVETKRGPGESPKVPNRGGPGSGRDAWAAYAAAHSVEVAEGMSRDDIIAALDAAGISTEG
jgi:hypothetical protein